MADPVIFTNPAVVSLPGLPESAEVAAPGPVSPGMPISRNDDGTVFPSENSTATGAAAFGIAMTHGTAGDQVLYVRGRTVIRPNDALTAGMTYAVGATGGSVTPEPNVTAGQYLTYLFYALDASNLQCMIEATGVQKA
jgi:hypothetical protein